MSAAVQSPLFQVIVQVDDEDAARVWGEESMTGAEGVVAKLDEPYPKPTSQTNSS